METEDDSFTWVIQNFNSIQSEYIYSDHFIAGGCKWRLMVYPKGNGVKYLSLFLEVADYETLPSGWRIQACYYVTVVNQLSEKRTLVRASQTWWFDDKTPARGFVELLPLRTLRARDGGFLVNGELKIVFDVEVHKVVGLVDVAEEVNQVQDGVESGDLHNENMDVNVAEDGVESGDLRNETIVINVDEDSVESGDLHNETIVINLDEDSVESGDLQNETMDNIEAESEEAGVETRDLRNETIDINEFYVLPSQVELLSRVLKKHPDIAVGFRSNEPYKKKASMNFVLTVIEMMCKSVKELTTDDLVEAEVLLKMVKDTGFKVDWLVKKLEEVKEKKKQLQINETCVKELKDLKQKGVDVEALLEKEKAKVLAIIASPLTLDDLL